MDISKVIAEAINNANENITTDDCYKGDDGLLYCSKCHTKKQFVNPITKKIMLCECQCFVERAQQERKSAKLRAMRERCFGDNKKFYTYTFENDDRANEKLTKKALRYVEKFEKNSIEGNGLLFFGGNGTGKTFMAVCIANALIDKGVMCYFANMATIKYEIEAYYGQKEAYLQRLNAYDLLIIDDLSLENQTDQMQELIYMVIENRLNSQKPLIITTNMTADDLSKPKTKIGERVHSRMIAICRATECNGKDRRWAEQARLKAELDN